MSQPEFKLKDNIATIKLCAEERKNALTLKDLALISGFLSEIKNEKLKCLIFSGEGNIFSGRFEYSTERKRCLESSAIVESC